MFVASGHTRGGNSPSGNNSTSRTRTKGKSKRDQPRDFSAAPPPARGETAPTNKKWKRQWRRQKRDT